MANRTDTEGHLPGLASNTIVYAGGLILSNALTFITFPILARGLTKGDFGVFDLYASIAILITVVLAFGIDSSVGRFFHEYDDHELRRAIVSEAFALQLCAIVLIVFALYFLSDSLVGYFGGNKAYASLFRLVVFQAGFQAALNFALNLLKWSFQKWQFIFLSVVSAGLGLCLTAVAIFAFQADLVGIFEAILIGRVASAILGLYLIRRWLQVSNRSFAYSGRLMKYAIPVGIVCIMEVMVPVIERNSILGILESGALGQYAAAAKLVSIMAVMVQAFQSAWGPLSLSLRNHQSADETYAITAKLYTLALCIGALALAYVGKPALTLLASERYDGAYVLIFPMVMALAIQSVGHVTEIGISISKRTDYQLLSYSIFVGVSIFLISVLTRHFGIFGTATAVLISNAIRTAIASLLAQQTYYIKWPFLAIASIFSTSIAIGAVLTILVANRGHWLSGVFLVASITALGYGVWRFLLDVNERLLVQSLWRRSRKKGGVHV